MLLKNLIFFQIYLIEQNHCEYWWNIIKRNKHTLSSWGSLRTPLGSILAAEGWNQDAYKRSRSWAGPLDRWSELTCWISRCLITDRWSGSGDTGGSGRFHLITPAGQDAMSLSLSVTRLLHDSLLVWRSKYSQRTLLVVYLLRLLHSALLTKIRFRCWLLQFFPTQVDFCSALDSTFFYTVRL